MCKQLSLLPLMHQFDDTDGFMKDTTYYETDACKENDYYLVFNKDYYTLLLPEDMEKWEWLGNIVNARTVVITKGSYKGKKDCYEFLFYDYGYVYEDGEEEDEEDAELFKDLVPYSIILQNGQFEQITPLKEGWHGRLNIYAGRLYDCKNWFEKVYYRVADTLPCEKLIEE